MWFFLGVTSFIRIFNIVAAMFVIFQLLFSVQFCCRSYWYTCTLAVLKYLSICLNSTQRLFANKNKLKTQK